MLYFPLVRNISTFIIMLHFQLFLLPYIYPSSHLSNSSARRHSSLDRARPAGAVAALRQLLLAMHRNILAREPNSLCQDDSYYTLTHIPLPNWKSGILTGTEISIAEAGIIASIRVLARIVWVTNVRASHRHRLSEISRRVNGGQVPRLESIGGRGDGESYGPGAIVCGLAGDGSGAGEADEGEERETHIDVWWEAKVGERV